MARSSRLSSALSVSPSRRTSIAKALLPSAAVAAHSWGGSAKAVAQARAMGYEAAAIHQTSGMIIRPDFYGPLALDRPTERARLGLDPQRPTGVVLFGGQGSISMLKIAEQLHDVQLVLMCGHHRVLAKRLRAKASSAPHAVVGFTPDVRRHLALGDFFIGKPGPGCLSEAVQQSLPVVTFKNALTMPQERYNADWVREHGLGIVSSSIPGVRLAVLELLSRFDEFKANVRRIENRAVFKVPGILAKILEARSPLVSPSQTSPPRPLGARRRVEDARRGGMPAGTG
jgi:UDP-N-acetylglucosamine:LPS N-acetylglucosamine transferase